MDSADTGVIGRTYRNFRLERKYFSSEKGSRKPRSTEKEASNLTEHDIYDNPVLIADNSRVNFWGV